MSLHTQEFENRESLAQALAHRVSQSLSKAISIQGRATLLVSGGNTPALFFEHLSRCEISWVKVIVGLVDEREVPETSERSNARLIDQHLLRNKAASADFVPLYQNTARASKLVPDCVVLGMGADGHTASFFPKGDRLAEAIDPHSDCAISTMLAPGAGESRLTYTLPRLLAAPTICLHIEGAMKKQVLEQALAGKDALQMPVRAVLHSGHPIEIYWCP